MWIHLLFLVISGYIYLVTSFGDVMLGPGLWELLHITQCEDHDQYDMIFDVTRKKLNRTHDGFNMHFHIDREINHMNSIEIVVYRKVDGGFKFQQKIIDKNACAFLMKYAHENVQRAFTMAKIDPPDCPIQPGDYYVNDFVMDYTELPENGVYGTYEVNTYLLHDGQKITCVQTLLHLEKHHDDD